MSTNLAQALMAWYAQHARARPWRHTKDPYAVWVSEVMLQQTRVETVIPYYERWMARLPTVEALAKASRDQVLGLWEGLGYYRRAHHLHQAARQVVDQHQGRLPDTTAQLQALPGVGRYTAAAIAAIAFGDDEIALDGNLRRVLSRLFDLDIDPRSPEGERRLLAEARKILPPGKAAIFNQALMDLSAALCTPREPSCHACPLSTYCLAWARNLQADRPVRGKRRTQPHHQVASGVVRQRDKVLIGRRPQGGLLGGLWEFPGGRLEPGETPEECLRRELREELAIEVQVGASIGIYNHAYTHFRITLHAFECRLKDGQPMPRFHSELRWAEVDRLGAFPMGKIHRTIAQRLANEGPHPLTSS
jgi:A/G-specific adenine glycosylase